MSHRPKLFLSYATEDSAVVAVLKAALEELRKKVNLAFDVFHDVRNIEPGQSIGAVIIEELETTDFLFIVYTEALKKSHSYTGQELGAFKALAYTESNKTAGKAGSRRIVSLYLHEPPAGQADELGIELDIENLDIENPDRLDPKGGLEKFFNAVLDVALAHIFVPPEGPTTATQQAELQNEQSQLRNNLQMSIKDDLIPKLLLGLVKELSSRVASRSIEQRFLELNWKKRKGGDAKIKNAGGAESENGERAKNASDDIMAGAELILDNPSTADVLGIDATTSITWEKFIDVLGQQYPSEAPFIEHALRIAVASGFSTGPIDNEQFFLSPSRSLYRVIVTRHYTYYDGSRHMNMYFIPMLSRLDRGDISIVLALLNVTTRYRTTFLDGRTSDLLVRVFQVLDGDANAFKQKVRKFVQQLLLIDDEMHVYGLDKRENIDKYYGDEIPASRVAELFAAWKKKTDTLKTLAAEITRQNDPFRPGNDDKDEKGSKATAVVSLFEQWIVELQAFDKHIDPINRQFGMRAAERLLAYFGGQLRLDGKCQIDLKNGNLSLWTASEVIPLTAAKQKDVPLLNRIINEAIERDKQRPLDQTTE